MTKTWLVTNSIALILVLLGCVAGSPFWLGLVWAIMILYAAFIFLMVGRVLMPSPINVLVDVAFDALIFGIMLWTGNFWLAGLYFTTMALQHLVVKRVKPRIGA